jgi:hypothetical protein
MNPDSIEPRYRSLLNAFSKGHDRIDLIEKDRNYNLRLIEAKLNDREIQAARNQIREYQSQMLEFEIGRC